LTYAKTRSPPRAVGAGKLTAAAIAQLLLRVLTTGPDQDAETGPVEGECESDGRDYKAEAEAIWRSAMLGLPI